jgi:FOG: GGDEF domain
MHIDSALPAPCGNPRSSGRRHHAMQISIQSAHRAELVRLDAIVFEHHLREAVRKVIPFESSSFLFPKKGDAACGSWSGKDKRLLLPIPDMRGGTLGIFVARGVNAAAAKPLLPHWEGIGHLIGENMLHFKRSLSDPVTGLFTRHYLLAFLERELEMLREAWPGSPREATKNESPAGRSGEDFSGRGAVGILVIRLAALRDIVREFGYQFADSLMVALADTFLRHCPEQAVAARTGDSEFSLVLPSATRKTCASLAASLANALGGVALEHPLRQERVSITASIGYVLYPQDVAGRTAAKPSAEQARLLLRKARLAAALADEESNDWNSTRHVMGFGSILSEGGRVLDVLPLSRVVVSLGANMQAREGQRFSVWSIQPVSESGGKGTPLYKGELALMEVHENTSVAEVIHIGDPAWAIAPGDRLVMQPEEQAGANLSTGVARPDPATGFLRYGDFLARWSEEREQTDKFAVALLRFSLARPHGEDAPAPQEGKEAILTDENPAALSEDPPSSSFMDSLHNHPDRQMAAVAGLIRDVFGKEILGGRYGLNSIILFHPADKGLPGQVLADQYATLASRVSQELELLLAVGIAPHPYLDFRKADTFENCGKALEYALLLPEPHVGLMDSLALNISADKRFSQGDTFGAIKEYKLALLDDESNILAWNSLGICLAGIGKHAEAEHYFRQALANDPKDIMALYNMGHLCQTGGRLEEAAGFFRACRDNEPNHLFALVRLGQIAESRGDREEARRLYEQAADMPGGKSMTYRHFAKLCIADGNGDEAREHLHSAILHDPQDAASLQMMAGLYLDAGEDPEMSASLARQSVALKPELRAGWLVLARALDALGKPEQAREARLKAGTT